MLQRFPRYWTLVPALFACFSALAQTSRISGHITDPQALSIPDAQVHAVNLDTGATYNAKSNESGEYTIPYLTAGKYQIEVRAGGFNTALSNDIRLDVGQLFVYDIQLTVGTTTSIVNVNAGSNVAQVETQNAEVSGTITGKEVAGIQLNGRNFTQLIALTPGVSNQTQQDEAKVGQAGSVAYSVNGGRTEYNSFSVDGSETLNVGINKDHSTLIVYPSIDAIQEIKVLTSNYGAQYPSMGNATTIVTTRSGTDSLHGNLYEFFRNEALNAKGYFDVTNGAPLYRRNDFGGTVGGPIVIPKLYDGKGRTHFFFSEEVRLEKSPTAYRQGVPSAAERNGDFNDVCPSYGSVSSVDPVAYPDCPVQAGGVPFLHNQLNYAIGNPGYGVNRNAVALLNTGTIPFPNATSGCNSSIGSCYNVDVSLPTYWREELFRIDHAINSKMQASFRYIHDEWDETTPIPPYAFLTNNFPTIQSRYYAPGLSMVARVTAALTPTSLNEFVASYTNSKIKLTNIPAQGVSLQYPSELTAPCSPDVMGKIQCGVTTIFNTGSTKLPGISIAGNNAAYGGLGFNIDPAYIPWEHTNPTYSFSDTFTKTLHRHNLQFGAQWIIYQRNQDNTPIGAATGDAQGIYTFSNVQGSRSTGNAFADFLYVDFNNEINPPFTPADLNGKIASFQQDSGQSRYRQRYQIVEPFIQDDFKVNSRLTINAGLRVSLFGTYRTVDENVYNWDPARYDKNIAATLSVNGTAGELVDVASGTSIPLNPNDPQANLDPRVLNGLVQCGKNGLPASCMSGHLFNPSPRVGFAWDLTGAGKTVLRGGYGIFFEHGTSDEANTGSLEGSAPVVLDMTALNPQGWGSIGRNVAYPLNVTSIPRKAVWSYVQQWSLSGEHELPGNTLFTLAYVGSRGNHLTAERQINQLPPLSTGANPFGLHEPIIRRGFNPLTGAPDGGDCGSRQAGFGGDGPAYQLRNGTVISGTAAALNFEAACYGTVDSLAQNPNALRTYAPSLGQIFSLENIAFSDYNAFQSSIRRTQGALTLAVAYTYSHSLDDASDRSDATFVNSADIRTNYASSNFDQRHLLHISYIYNLPLLTFWQHFASTISRDPDPENRAAVNKPPDAFATSSVAKLLLNGWQLSGITLYETGIPFTVVNNGSPTGISVLDNAGVANGIGSGSYPDIIGNPRGARPRQGTNSASFGPLLRNPGAFAAPRGLTFGNAGRNSLNNPQRWNFDTALLKTFPLREGLNMEFRAEAFNLFNHTQFRIFNPTLGNEAQNTVSCYGGPVSNYSAAGGDGTDCLTGSSFLHPVDAHRPRTIQFAVKLAF